jgi:hypothetical protein
MRRHLWAVLTIVVLATPLHAAPCPKGTFSPNGEDTPQACDNCPPGHFQSTAVQPEHADATKMAVRISRNLPHCRDRAIGRVISDKSISRLVFVRALIMAYSEVAEVAFTPHFRRAIVTITPVLRPLARIHNDTIGTNCGFETSNRLNRGRYNTPKRRTSSVLESN